jgi:benzoate membrane transport protein
VRFSVFAAALVAVATGFGGTMAVVAAAAQNLGVDQVGLGSWVWALCLGTGVSSIWLSVAHRMPIVTAWSLAGAVMIAGIPHGVTMAQAVPAFLFCGVLMALSGLAPVLGAAVGRLPASLGAAMLAGLLLRFVLALLQAAQIEPLMVLPLLLIYLVMRRVHAASAPLVLIAAGLPLASVLGHTLPPLEFGLAVPVWTSPVFDLGVLLGLGLPLFLVTMATQQVPGAAVLRVFGYTPPVRSTLFLTGGLTVLLAPFGGYAMNLSSFSAALCTGPDAHPDPERRWITGVVYGVLYLVLAVFGAGFTTMLTALPPVLVTTVAGAALLGPMTNAMAAAVAVEKQRFAAVAAFGVTASGVMAFGLGGAFWGLVAGVLVLGIDALPLRGRIRPERR